MTSSSDKVSFGSNVFGPMSIGFQHPTEFTLPHSFLFSNPSVVSTITPDRISDTVVNPVSAVESGSSWSVVSVPASASVALSLTGESVEDSDEMKRFAQMPHIANKSEASKLYYCILETCPELLKGLKVGLDSTEPLGALNHSAGNRVVVTPELLIFALNQLADRLSTDENLTPLFSAAGTKLDQRHPGAATREGLRTALMSEACVQHLAWQRIQQLITDTTVHSRLNDVLDHYKEEYKVSHEFSAIEDGARATPITHPYTEASAGSVSAAEPADKEISQLRRAARILLLESILGTEGARVSSRGVQTQVQVGGANGTLPYADEKSVLEALNECAAAFSSAEKDLSHEVITVRDTVNLSACSTRQLSPFYVIFWSVKRGLLPSLAEQVKREEQDNDGAENELCPAVLSTQLPFGITTVGVDVGEGVEIGLGNVSAYPKTLHKKQLRIIIERGEDGNPTISLFPCAGVVRIEGDAKYSAGGGERISIQLGQRVRFGADMTMVFTLAKETPLTQKTNALEQ